MTGRLLTALLEELAADPVALERLRELVGEVPTRVSTSPLSPVVYSPATLAAELGRSPRSIRAAISRGELQAVKRGAGWVISAEAVAAWSRADSPVQTSAPRRRRARAGDRGDRFANSVTKAPRSNGGPMARALRS